jgi:MFS family permease
VAITAMWFTRQQQPLVIGCWYASQGLGIGLGGILGYGIGQMRVGIANWRMIFLLIGAACALWGVAMAFIIPDSPHTTTRFTREEKLVIMSRKRDDYHQAEKRQTNWAQARECLWDVKIWLYFFLGFTANVVSGEGA